MDWAATFKANTDLLHMNMCTYRASMVGHGLIWDAYIVCACMCEQENGRLKRRRETWNLARYQPYGIYVYSSICQAIYLSINLFILNPSIAA
ncbi:hypothetical protein BD289DRAFT_442930 [Coniella lustricola]|uniref:Uncharacterized protein n=1 Tax=Coniella lustricola TaxID=2025994 RepID=A0A2T2ZXM8_9PEZI|nr:hypothetical protein BD289DRAFT_442930 [Coniella lustricola]